MKTKEELTALKAEVETLSMKLRELSEEELRQVTGGMTVPFEVPKGKDESPFNFRFYDNNVERDFEQKSGN